MRFDGLSSGRVGINGVRNFRQALASPHPVEVSRFGAAIFQDGASMNSTLSKLSRFAAIVVLAVVVPGCAAALRSPSISELQRHPGRYQDHSVSVNGVVTTSWGLPLVPFRMYKVDDGTGEVTVLSQGTRMPARGERVRVKGRVNEVAVFGGQAIGLHLREESIYVKR
jgi:hypothetical protein